MPKDLPSDLHLQWKWEFHSPEPAFPSEEVRLNFDPSYEPVTAKHTIFIPSMVTGSITALDTRTGKENWKFYSDGPVRFAPVVWKEKIYFGSDDGFLYCLDAANGQLKWKFRASLEELKSYKLLGNSRLISRWAVRGGPVLKDGIIYFGSGLWPSEGVYVYAVDAKSGELIWRNDNLAFLENALVDHSARRNIGLAPLGYLTIAGDKLIVPVGRALPAILDLHTGEMEPYSTGWGGRGGLARGSWWVCSSDDYYFTSGELYGLSEHLPETDVKEFMTPDEFAEATNLSTGKVRNLMQNGKLSYVMQDGQEVIDIQPEMSYLTSDKSQNYEAEVYVLKNYPRLQISEGNKYNMCDFRRPIMTGNTVYYSVPVPNDSIGFRFPGQTNGARNIDNARNQAGYSSIEAYDFNSASDWVLTATQNSPDEDIKLYRTVEFERLWKLDRNLNIHFKAGNRLYGSAPGFIAAIDIEKEPGIIWQKEIEGTPSTMLAGDDRLYVVTREGMLYCFGSDKGDYSDYKADRRDIEYSDQDIQIGIDEILSSIEWKKGYCYILGNPGQELIQKILQETELNIIMLESDRQKVRESRQFFDRLGIYGKRVQVVSGNLSTMNLPPYTGNLVISLNSEYSNFDVDPNSIKQLVSLIHPFGGIAYLSIPDQLNTSLEDRLKQLDVPGIHIERRDEFALLKRDGAPRGSAAWTHEEGSSANTSSNMDMVIKPPMAVTWFGGPLDDSIFSKLTMDYTHSRPPIPLVCDGRMFFIVFDELHALDVYTGYPLWKTTLPQSFKTKSRLQEHFTGRRNTANNYIATSDVLYIFLESSCLKIDPATGAQIGKLTTPALQENVSGKELLKWHEARVWENMLLVNIGKYLVCMDRHTGVMQWNESTHKDRFNFAAGNNKVFLVDYWLPNRRKSIVERESKIQTLEITSGKLLWETSTRLPVEDGEGLVEYIAHPIDPYLSYSVKQDVLLLSNRYNVMGAYSGSEGKQLWRNEEIRIPKGFPPVLLSEKFVTNSGWVYDLFSGARDEGQLFRHIRGCNPPIGNQQSILARDGVPTIYRFDTGSQNLFLSSRSGCTNNLIPGNGVLTILNLSRGCACNYPVFASFGAVHLPEAAKWNKAAEAFSQQIE
ncbi:MAG: PQQ-binding-like beta-propeller repeat protein [Bacteroidetes bacterium]|nr:PQQ-binding-like beta-propeller repeat protein [Bacteroidota bacterium]